ncbi:MAG: YbaK/EbsC family protein [Candidatus Caldarchaeum sp.]|nr:YbaK/EbsC family protein [Candidatus Caldarchaeum sp.]MDW8435654.1 YbaK/EbsC family protein [Candidatus Caldarchaeum sp.]
MAVSLKRFIESRKIDAEFVELLPEQAKTSESAAAAVNTSVNQIAKSIVLRGSKTYVVVLAGDKRIDLKKFSRVVGEPVRLASPDEVLESTGFNVGCVPPFGHLRKLKTFIDVSLLRNDVVYASGGTDSSLLKISVTELLRILGSDVVDVTK